MMKKLYLFLLFLGGFCNLSALEILVFDKDLEMPLEGAQVRDQEKVLYTDEQGILELVPAEPGSVTTLLVSYPGYITQKVQVLPGQNRLTVLLSLEGLLEGEELVVEHRAPQKTDAQVGISQVVTREEFRSTAEIGIVEDVMSTIKTLPGVGYAGGWNAAPSIRGGDPSEVTAVLDGFYVSYPYHWGGAFSIFNPNMVESAKLSNGIFSAQYGQVLSGLLEVNSRVPQLEKLSFSTSISTTGAEIFLESPLSSEGGILLGGKITWIDVALAMVGGDPTIVVAPYIRDAYGKAFWKPDPRFELFLNAFLGTDGVSNKGEAKDSTLVTTNTFDWTNIDGLISGGIKVLPVDSLFVQLSGGWNRHFSSPKMQSSRNGYRNYSTQFLDLYDGSASDPDGTTNGLIGGQAGYTLNNVNVEMFNQMSFSMAQGKLLGEWEFTPGQIIGLGVEEVGQLWDYDNTFTGTSYLDLGSSFVLQDLNYIMKVEGNRLLSTGGWALWNFDWGQGYFTGEAGVRVQYHDLTGNGIHFATQPDFAPRLHLALTPWRKVGNLDYLTFTTGTGLFSKLDTLSALFEKKYNLQEKDIKPTRAWFSMAGLEAQWSGGWKVSAEFYFKSYWDRLYIAADPLTTPMTFSVRTDGIGQVYGADFLLQKKSGDWWDGYLTYSFAEARYLNPLGRTNAQQYALVPSQAPLDEWYYPSYHRHHSLNLIFNWNPTSQITLTTKASVASGAPRDEILGSSVVPATYGSQVVEYWRQDKSYSDTLRNSISCPIDLKFTLRDSYGDSGIDWELYAGVENIFVNLYKPTKNADLDPSTGKPIPGSDSADFSIGMPIPSFGFKIKY